MPDTTLKSQVTAPETTITAPEITIIAPENSPPALLSASPLPSELNSLPNTRAQTSPSTSSRTLRSHLPNLESLLDQGPHLWRSELSAGLTTAALLIPQSMAYAMLAGLPPQVGLYAALAPILIYAALGSARTLSVGPVAMDSMLTLATLGGIATVMSAHYVELAGLFALCVGVLLLIMSALRFGKLAQLLKPSMMSGFTSAAAFMIAFSQLKSFSGVPLERQSVAQAVLVEVYHKISLFSPLTLCIGVGSLLIFRRLPKIKSAANLPAGLIGIALMTLISASADLESYGVAVVGQIPQGLPSLTLPHWESARAIISGPHGVTFISGAMSVAVLAFMEAIAIGRIIASAHGYQVRPGQELFALGASNIAAALFGGYPITGGLSRTAVNDRAGARTPLASVITFMLVALVVWRLTPILYALPLATLAAMIINAVVKLIDLKTPRALWSADRPQAVIWLLTFSVTLTLGLHVGIIMGLGLSLLSYLLSPSSRAATPV